MANLQDKQIYTTGQVAVMCGCAPRTVSNWFDSGRLRGYRIPGSNDRRIPREQLLRFLRENGMPIPKEIDTEITGTASPNSPVTGSVNLEAINEIFLNKGIKDWTLRFEIISPTYIATFRWVFGTVEYRFHFYLTEYTVNEGILALKKNLEAPLSTWKLA